MSIYPNDYCHECQQTPPVEQPAPPPCVGEPCEEILDTKCISYAGADIPCKGIKTGDRLDKVINDLATCYDENFVRSLLRMIRDDSALKTLFAQIVCSVDCLTITLCQIPAGITRSNSTSQGFTVSWTKITGVSGYYIRVRKSSSISWTQVGGLLPNSSFSTGTASAVITGLDSGSAYYIQVKTLCTDGSESSWSTEISADTVTPVAPPICNIPNVPTVTIS
jgi:hypothetical protein